MENLLVYSSVAGLVCVSLVAARAYSLTNDSDCKRKILAGGIRTFVANLFPLMIYGIGKGAICTPAILWVLISNLVDSYFMWNVEGNDPSRLASLKLEPTVITSLTFSLCVYLNAKADHKYGDLFLFAIMGCLLCVLPSHSMKPGCVEEQVFESVQKSMLFNCVGVLVAGVCLVRKDSQEKSG